MQDLRLTGHLSYIDGKKLVCEFLDNYDEGFDDAGKRSTSREKLERMFRNESHPPYDRKTFRVFVRDVTPDIRAMVGRQVSMLVRPQHYAFVSRSTYNRREKVSGYKLTLETIDYVKQL